ncbi:Tetratricopeptide repeat protein 5 [Hondaea fermentalgiana]|uniref:Tetratricopeptide repeat protein 5 n=1 Tax=Hondaea fermentalgiana TaxID=2315210 RepID=A0A2R5GGF1_9STRA|nr:Tetratricopeptide repeat protein 5 [Hondaea fermentalgiana]|eukprot:GBG29419.1 Tetratricopeptide repeat protein 5 [Hondaea fermentalgiana]
MEGTLASKNDRVSHLASPAEKTGLTKQGVAREEDNDNEQKRCAQDQLDDAETMILKADALTAKPVPSSPAPETGPETPPGKPDAKADEGNSKESLLTKAEALLLSAASDAAGNSAQEPRVNKARRLFLEARIRALRGEQGSSELLSRAVKLNPRNADAWNHLAEALWRDGNLKEARDCLLSSLEQGPEKATLRNYSMLLRKLDGTAKEKADNMTESLARAKAAVALDVGDAESWYVLGNTYMAYFFALSHDLRNLEAALKAYRRSEDLGSGAANPDLYYNRAQVFTFLENFPSAVSDYERAHTLDGTLGAASRARALRDRVKSLALAVERKGRIKPKRLVALQGQLARSSSPDDALCLSDLKAEQNADSKLEIMILSNASVPGSPPATFIALDRNGHVFAVSVFHLDDTAQTRLAGSRERIVLCNPLFRTVELDGVSYPSVQIQHPAQVLLNGIALESSFAHATLATSTI